MIRPLVTALALAFAWVFVGRQLTLLDRFVTIKTVSLAVNPLEYDGSGFLIGQLPMTFGSIDNQRFDLALRSDSANRIVLSSGGQSFTLGPRTNPVDPSGRPEIDFVPEPGDELTFTAARSVLAWPTPFEFNIMIPHSPWWKRYVYFRLLWKLHRGSGVRSAASLPVSYCPLTFAPGTGLRPPITRE